MKAHAVWFGARGAGFLLSLAVVLPASAGASDWNTISVVAEGASINVVLPYAKTPDDDPRVAFARKTQATSKVDLLAECLTDVPYRHAQVGQFVPSRGYKYSPDRWYLELNKQREDFARQHPEITASMFDKVLDKATKEEVAAKGISWAFEKPILFPISDDSMRHYTSLMLFGIQTEVNGVSERHVVVGSMTQIFVGGELLSVMIYEPFVDRNTYVKVQELTKDIVRRTLEANPMK